MQLVGQDLFVPSAGNQGGEGQSGDARPPGAASNQSCRATGDDHNNFCKTKRIGSLRKEEEEKEREEVMEVEEEVAEERRGLGEKSEIFKHKTGRQQELID